MKRRPFWHLVPPALIMAGALVLQPSARAVLWAASPTFPTITLQYLHPTQLDPNAVNYQIADFDAARNRVLFYPWGDGNNKWGGNTFDAVMLIYHADKPFLQTSSYQTVDLTTLVNTQIRGFGGGFMDDTGSYDYLADRGANAGMFARANLGMDLATAGAYETFNVTGLAGLPALPTQLGWAGGTYASGFAYFSPAVSTPTAVSNSFYLRYDASQPFGSAAAWSTFDLSQLGPKIYGFQSAITKLPYVYLVPFGIGFSKFVRYNTTLPFNDPRSYEVYDVAKQFPGAVGFTGANVVGNDIVFQPSRDWSQPGGQGPAVSIAAKYDTTKDMKDPTAWSFMDLSTVDPAAVGYQYGWLDKSGFLWFIPNFDWGGTNPVPPFIAWDTKLPFESTSSWKTTSSGSVQFSCGGAYDPVTNRAWLASFGNSNTMVPQVSITAPPPLVPARPTGFRMR